VALFYYFYSEMLCAGRGSHQCRSKSNIAKQNLQNLYNFRAALLILHMTANSAHVGQFCTKFCARNSEIPSIKCYIT